MTNGAFGHIVPDGPHPRCSTASYRSPAFRSASTSRTSPRPSARPASCRAGASNRIIGVDRLDYTKGLPQKFKAFGRFLEKNPQYRRQVVLTQIAPPTRESVEAYLDIRQQLESLAGSINGRFGELDWVPIHYIHRSTPRRRLAGIYRSSRIGMVTPLRDGMNLVAKEYVAAQDAEDPGVLILSQFAGAAEEMSEALIVNPYDIDATADVIRVALEMSLSERRERHHSFDGGVEKNDINAWCRSFLAALEQVRLVRRQHRRRGTRSHYPGPGETAKARQSVDKDPEQSCKNRGKFRYDTNELMKNRRLNHTIFARNGRSRNDAAR